MAREARDAAEKEAIALSSQVAVPFTLIDVLSV
jgi:hypothetical protein